MGISRTFSIHFWLNLAKKKGDLEPTYSGGTIDTLCVLQPDIKTILQQTEAEQGKTSD